MLKKNQFPHYAFMQIQSPNFLLLMKQGGHIRMYNVDKGWKVQKDILTKSLRWTITDTSLSPDQRYLVSY